MLSLKDFENELTKIDKTKLGSIYGGVINTDGGTETFGGGSVTVEFSSDTIIENLTILHKCENGLDVNCEDYELHIT